MRLNFSRRGRTGEEKEEEAGGTEARRSVYPGLGTLNLEARGSPGIAGKGEGGGGDFVVRPSPGSVLYTFGMIMLRARNSPSCFCGL